MTKEEKNILLEYINTCPNWKMAIKRDWDRICPPVLRQIRNNYGPTWLMKLTANKVRSTEVQE